jgi:methylenetetrahydrofolate dehydrogenase (NADP+)/methenyltetrahydrofolate cyclohydrolase
MTAKILDGKKVADKIKKELKEKVKGFKIKPGLAVVLVGNDDASHMYVNFKEKACNDNGFHSQKHVMDENASIGDIISKIDSLNNDPKIHGILVQLPLPNNQDGMLVLDAVRPDKDVDGFHPLNLGNLFVGNPVFEPCTPKGMIRLLDEYNIDIQGKNAVVVGRSVIVGKPMTSMLLNRNATVTICHRKTKDLKKHCSNADILVSAVGKKDLITADMVKKGAVVLDAGTVKVDGKVYGDVDYEGVKKVASWITLVPGGVGPMTIACLLENTIECMRVQKLID